MKPKVNAAVYYETGNPPDVVRCEPVDLPEPGAGQIAVRMLAAPINPADLNSIEGKYPVKGDFPRVPGMEGVGVAEGPGAGGVDPGMRVLLAPRLGSWREALTVDAGDLIPIPAGIDLDQAAMLRVNPPTAWRMLHDFIALKPGDWVIQNAANSGVGRAVIQICKVLGVRTINLVRRSELIAELTAAGADAVLTGEEDLKARAKEITQGEPIRLGLNAVGGESALALANALAESGALVTYGAMGKQPIRVPNGLLIFKDLRWRGFWITKWYERASQQEKLEMFGRLFPLAEKGVLHAPVARKYPLSEVVEAIRHAMEGGRSGKILLGMNG